MPCLGTTLNLTFNLINTLDDWRDPANALFWITVWITTYGPSTTLHGPGLLILFAGSDRLSIKLVNLQNIFLIRNRFPIYDDSKLSNAPFRNGWYFFHFWELPWYTFSLI